MTTPERMGIGWLLWVLGWALLVGSVLFVAPAFVVFGMPAAAWVFGAVLALSFCLAWLAAEAGQALNAEAERSEELAPAGRGASKQPLA